MAKYRKRPIIVEAAQWNPGREIPGVFEVSKAQRIASLLSARIHGAKEPPPDRPYVVTIHGQRAYLDPGDWVIVESDGEHHYPIKPDEFARIYEPVD